MPTYTVGANRVLTGHFVIEADSPGEAETIAQENMKTLEHVVDDESMYVTFATPGDEVS